MASATLFVNGSRVTEEFRDAVFATAERLGMSASEFVLLCTAERLVKQGIPFEGVFAKGDIDFFREKVGA